MLQHGVPDIVISNAGVSSGTLTENKTDTAIFKAVIDINLIGMVNTFQPFLLAMKKEKKGSLVGIASVAGIRAAVISYLESLRVELNSDGLAVTTITPGYIRTPMTDLNGFPMPFLMAPEVAARKFSKAIKRKKKFIIFPWQMRWAAVIMRATPAWLWDIVIKNAPRKARAHWDWL